MRPSATIVIPAWNEWPLTRTCLETLRPTLGLRDQVVVVDNGSADGTAEGLRRYSWVTVVSHDENKGFAAGCNAGAAVATGEVVVFLNNDTLLPARWLDGLLAPFTDPGVAATGPRSNFVSGPQLVPDTTYDPGRTADLQRFARTWRDEHRGQTTAVDRLVGFCLAVRRQSLEQVGGFDEGFGIGGAEDDDLCLRLRDAGHRLLIAHESFVHHHGHRTFEGNGVDWYALQEQNLTRLAAKRGRRQRRPEREVLLSACMIVKDEEANLPSCLAALEGVVDEVVIYDTGSSDDTVRLAREAGATVLEGYWDDDFARARNAALDACSGQWILHVDADEVVEADAAVVRAELRDLVTADAMSVSIANVGDDGTVAVSHNATRLFRRGRARWSGRLHEQIVSIEGQALSGCRSSLALRHTGYTTEAVAAGDKMARNLRVAELNLRDAGDGDAFALINLGRSLTGVGRNAEALVQFDRALAVTDQVSLRRQALRFGVEVLLGLGRPAEALARVHQFREVCSSPVMPDYFEGLARYSLRDAEGAIACFDRIDDSAVLGDEDISLPVHFLAARKGMALLSGERWDEAAQVLYAAVRDQGATDPLFTPLLESYVQAGLPLSDLVALDAHPRALHLLGHGLNASPAAAEALALHLWESPQHRTAVVACLARLAPGLPLEHVLDWSLRLRSAGYGDHCPLPAFAASDVVPALERLKAVAVLMTSLGDAGARGLLDGVAQGLGDPELQTALLVLDELAPALLPELITTLVNDRRRIPSTARALDELGAHEQAEALREHFAA
jgi:GT2 family glycosyltransferase/tetratricopeptide (TPR) repeat protein